MDQIFADFSMSATEGTGPAERITLRRPDDWHVHVRSGAMLRAVLPYTARAFGRAIIMPNLVPPVTTSGAVATYRKEILAALPADAGHFTPLMTLYLTEETDPDDLAFGHMAGLIVAAKLYPANATTNSAAGVTDMRQIDRVLDRMEQMAIPLLVHGEVTDPAVDIFDREAVFLDHVLAPLLDRFQGIKVVLEHITTKDAVDFVRSRGETGRVAATITAHHLLINRNAMFEGGLQPHHYCLPVAKREQHRQAVLEAATSGERWFFLGTDSAPHPTHAKEAACGCAGIFTAPAALGLYAEAFAAAGALDRLEAFASLNGPNFYGLAANTRTITLERAPTPVPERIETPSGEQVIPFRAGGRVAWRPLAPSPEGPGHT